MVPAYTNAFHVRGDLLVVEHVCFAEAGHPPSLSQPVPLSHYPLVVFPWAALHDLRVDVFLLPVRCILEAQLYMFHVPSRFWIDIVFHTSFQDTAQPFARAADWGGCNEQGATSRRGNIHG